MPNATVRANARAMSKSAKSASSSPTPEAEPYGEDVRLQSARITAEYDLNNRLDKIRAEIAAEKEKAEAAAKTEETERGRDKAFDQAYHDWLRLWPGATTPRKPATRSGINGSRRIASQNAD